MSHDVGVLVFLNKLRAQILLKGKMEVCHNENYVLSRWN
jgi:hypothetical protein